MSCNVQYLKDNDDLDIAANLFLQRQQWVNNELTIFNNTRTTMIAAFLFISTYDQSQKPHWRNIWFSNVQYHKKSKCNITSLILDNFHVKYSDHLYCLVRQFQIFTIRTHHTTFTASNFPIFFRIPKVRKCFTRFFPRTAI